MKTFKDIKEQALRQNFRKGNSFTEGKTVMDDPGVLSDEELEEGFILTCISKPDSEEITNDFDDI